jgi:hypothetical protein
MALKIGIQRVYCSEHLILEGLRKLMELSNLCALGERAAKPNVLTKVADHRDQWSRPKKALYE